MGLCFCDRAVKEKTASEHEAPDMPTLPAVPPPARLSSPRSELPEKVALSTRGVSCGHESPLASAPAPPFLPLPRDLEAKEHLETTTGDDGGKSQLAASPASKSAAVLEAKISSELSVDKPDAGQPGPSTYVLGNLVDRENSSNRTSSPEPTRCRAVETESDKEDYAVAARRAEVRRLAHTMIQEELRQEHHSQLPRSYKSKTMTTINEDPSDSGATVGAGSGDKVTLGCDGPPGDHAVVAPCSRSKDSALVRPKAAAHPTIRSFSLHPGSVSVMHRGLLGFRRFRGANTAQPRSWKWPSLMATSTQQKSSENGDLSTVDMPALPAAASRDKENVSLLDPKGKGPAVGGHDSKSPPLTNLDTENESVIAKGKRHLFVSLGNDNRVNQFAISESLSSVDEDGSIHEAREAHVVLKKKGGKHSHSGTDEGALGIAALKNGVIEAIPRLSSFIHAASGDGTSEMRRPSGISGTSHISSLNLPPPLVDGSNYGDDATARDPETDRFHKTHAPLHKLSWKVTSRDVSTEKKPKNAQAMPSSPRLPAQGQRPDATAMQALKSRRRALLAEIGITLKKISRTPLDSRFRSTDDRRQETQPVTSQTTGGEPVPSEASAPSRLTNTVDTPSEQDQTSPALALERMEEEWLRQIRQLHIGGLESQQRHTRNPGKNKKYQSQTWPPASYSPTLSLFSDVFEDSPQEPQQFDLDTLSLRNQPREQRQRVSAFAPSNRPRSEILGPTNLPESWWSMSVNTSVPDVHDSSAGNAAEEQASSATPADKTDHDKYQTQTATGPAAAVPTKFEKVVKFGMLKFLSRRQTSNALPDTGDETSAGASAENSTKPTAPEEVGTTPKAPIETSDQQARSFQARHGTNLLEPNGNQLEDDTNTIRVLTDRASNQVRFAASEKNKDGGTTAVAGTKPATVQVTAPSTPVKEAYAEVHAYIAKSSAENHASRVAGRVSSFSTVDSFADAVAHQHGGEEHGKQEKEDRAELLNDSPASATRTPWWMLRTMAPASKA